MCALPLPLHLQRLRLRLILVVTALTALARHLLPCLSARARAAHAVVVVHMTGGAHRVVRLLQVRHQIGAGGGPHRPGRQRHTHRGRGRGVPSDGSTGGFVAVPLPPRCPRMRVGRIMEQHGDHVKPTALLAAKPMLQPPEPMMVVLPTVGGLVLGDAWQAARPAPTPAALSGSSFTAFIFPSTDSVPVSVLLHTTSRVTLRVGAIYVNAGSVGGRGQTGQYPAAASRAI